MGRTGALPEVSRAILAAYFRSQPDVVAAFLFGSQARGTARDRSDVDIAVLLEHDGTANPYRLPELANDLMGLLGRDDLDVVELNSAPPLLSHRVARDGAVLYATSNTVVAEFVIHALQQLEDTRPLRDLQAMQTKQIFGYTERTTS